MSDKLAFRIEENYSKEDLQTVTKNIIESVNEGFSDPLEIHIMGKALIKIGSALEKTTKEAAISKAYQKGNIKGAEYQVQNGATLLNYSADPVYADLEKQLKARQELLKMAWAAKATLSDDNGEVIPKVPVKSYGGETIKISFK